MPVLATAEGVAAITVVGALIVAAITAVTTNRRQRESLAHDRELSDLDDLRRLLDEAAAAINQARAARKQVDVNVSMIGLKGVPPDWREELAEEASKVIDDVQETLTDMSARLQVRLGADDPITRALDEVMTALHRIGARAFMLQFDETDQADYTVKAQAAGKDFDTSAGTFLAAAVARAGTVPIRERGRED